MEIAKFVQFQSKYKCSTIILIIVFQYAGTLVPTLSTLQYYFGRWYTAGIKSMIYIKYNKSMIYIDMHVIFLFDTKHLIHLYVFDLINCWNWNIIWWQLTVNEWIQALNKFHYLWINYRNMEIRHFHNLIGIIFALFTVTLFG